MNKLAKKIKFKDKDSVKNKNKDKDKDNKGKKMKMIFKSYRATVKARTLLKNFTENSSKIWKYFDFT